MPDDSRGEAPIGQLSLLIQRRNTRGKPTVRELYVVPLLPRLTLAEALGTIQERCTTADGTTTTPVRFEAPCCHGACGGCLVRVEGRARLACTTYLEEFGTKRKKPVLVDAPARLELHGDLSSVVGDSAASSQLLLWSDSGLDRLPTRPGRAGSTPDSASSPGAPPDEADPEHSPPVPGTAESHFGADDRAGSMSRLRCLPGRVPGVRQRERFRGGRGIGSGSPREPG